MADTTRVVEVAEGCRLYPAYLDPPAQQALLADVRAALAEAPLFAPSMPGTGKPLSVRMSNMGPLGWVTDREGGYRYQAQHPLTLRPWPPIAPRLLAIWHQLVSAAVPPEACLVNYYGPEARLGLHRDEDEIDRQLPILSISLGDTARFRLGGLRRRDPCMSFELKSGDVFVFGPPLRLAYHGVDRIYAGSSRLLAEGGRFNLTLRRVNPADAAPAG